MALRVLHLAGSPVSEFFGDLSRLYARDCLAATENPGRYEPVIAYVTPGGGWRFPDDLSTTAIVRAPTLSVGEAVARIAELRVDVMLPQMFCLPGMTSYRGLFDLLEIPYVGNPPDVMALTANKARAKAVVAAAGVAVPRGVIVRPGEHPEMALPAVVKPIDADNSLGVTLVRDSDALAAAVDSACAHADAALVEEYVALGREVRCGIVVRGGQLLCLPLEEYRVDPDRKPIRDADDKLARNPDGELALVAKERTRAWILNPDDPITTAVWAAARRCHVALGCRDYSLFDFRVDPDGRPWFLEAGLYCSFARQSVISMMAAATGISLDELFASALVSALGAKTLSPSR